MKLQHLSVIFIIIVVPIAMVLSVYIGNLIDVANTESTYNSLLLNSTYDAVRAYQVNTLNNAYSSETQSKERDIKASINSFFNSLASGLGASGYTKTELNSYVPAMLYTMYDGYYIYGPYNNVSSINEGTVDYTEKGDIKNDTVEYGLKPYVYYSCEYSKENDYDIIVNYTLDNYISVMGTYKDIENGNISKYISASGYYINPEKVSLPIQVNNVNEKIVTLDSGNNGKIKLEPETLGEYISTKDTYKETNGSYITKKNDVKYYNYIIYNNVKYYYDDNTSDLKNESYANIPIFKLDKNLRVYINDDLLNDITTYMGCSKEEVLRSDKLYYKDLNAYYYYQNAKDFSSSIYKVLKNINVNDESVIKTDTYNKNYVVRNTRGEIVGENKNTSHVKTEYNTGYIFDYEKTGNNPELESSSFNEHRTDVIISSIESSLINAIANFNNYISSSYEYEMPALSETDWYKIANNVTTVAFMEGLSIKNYKYYSNYAIVTNTKNNEFISKDSIYVQDDYEKNDINCNSSELYLKGSYTKTDGQTVVKAEYHNPRCNNYNDNNNKTNDNVIGYRNVDYERQSYTYADSNGENKEELYYNQPGTGGYECIVSQNANNYTTDDLLSNNTGNEKVSKAYIIALARERGALYKKSSFLNAHYTETTPQAATMRNYTVHYCYEGYDEKTNSGSGIYSEEGEKYSNTDVKGKKITSLNLQIDAHRKIGYTYAGNEKIKVKHNGQYISIAEGETLPEESDETTEIEILYKVDTTNQKRVYYTVEKYVFNENNGKFDKVNTQEYSAKKWVNASDNIEITDSIRDNILNPYNGRYELRYTDPADIQQKLEATKTNTNGDKLSVATETIIRAYYGADKNLYDKTYTIRYHGISNQNGTETITGTMENQVLEFYKHGTLNENKYARTGYTFEGWKAEKGNQSYINKEDIIIGSDVNLSKEGDIYYLDLYAQWKEIIYQVSYSGKDDSETGNVKNETSGIMSNSIHKFDTDQNLSTNSYKRQFNVRFNLGVGSTNYYTEGFLLYGTSGSISSTNNEYTVTINKGAKDTGLIYSGTNAIIEAGKTATISYEVNTDISTNLAIIVQNNKVGEPYNYSRVDGNNIATTPIKVEANTWTKISTTYTNKTANPIYDYSLLTLYEETASQDTIIKVKNVKIEMTNIETSSSSNSEIGTISSTFKNWRQGNTTLENTVIANATGKEYQNNETVRNLTNVQDAVVELKATWEDNEIEMPKAYCEGYEFEGWKDKDGNIYQAGVKKVISKNTELTAIFEDKIPPQVDTNTIQIGTNKIVVESTATDKGSGMISEPIYTYYIKKTGDSDSTYKEIKSSTSNNCEFDKLQSNTSYTIKTKVESDNTGNSGENIINVKTLELRGTIYVETQAWVQDSNGYGKQTIVFGAKDITETADKSSIYIEYKNGINGTWTKGNIASGINNGETVYARLTDGVNYLSSISVKVVDNIAPIGGTITMQQGNYNGIEYKNNSWTKENVYIKLADGKDYETGLKSTQYSINGVVYNDKETTITQEGTYTIIIITTDNAGNVTRSNPYTVKIDKTKPIVTFNPNGSAWYEKQKQSAVTVSDGASGTQEYSLKYMWTQSTASPSEREFSTLFINGHTLIINGVTGNNWYLWIRAQDNAGNVIITRSEAFYLDNTPPIPGTLNMKFGNGTNYLNGTWAEVTNPVYVSVNNGWDAHSGHNRTYFSVNGGAATTSATINSPGQYSIVVTTYDNAGNYAQTSGYIVRIKNILKIGDYVTYAGANWRVFEINYGNVVMIANESHGWQGFSGPDGFNNAVITLNNTCAGWYNSSYASARSLNIDDLAKAINFDYHSYWGDYGWYDGKKYPYILDQQSYLGWSGQNYYTYGYNNRGYSLQNTNVETGLDASRFKSWTYYQMFMNKNYWLATRCFRGGQAGADFRLQYIDGGRISSEGLTDPDTNRYDGDYSAHQVCPIVTINTNIVYIETANRNGTAESQYYIANR